MKIYRYLPEAAATIAITGLISAIIRFSGGYSNIDHGHESSNILLDHDTTNETFNPYKLGFSSSVFYFFFLPPILFNSGYHLKRTIMFANFGAIITLAVLGTIISIFIVTTGIYLMKYLGILTSVSLSFMEIIAFASLISSTDPVATLSIYIEKKVGEYSQI